MIQLNQTFKEILEKVQAYSTHPRQESKFRKCTSIPTGNIRDDFKVLSKESAKILEYHKRIPATIFICQKENARVMIMRLTNDYVINKKIFKKIGENMVKCAPNAYGFIFMTQEYFFMEDKKQQEIESKGDIMTIPQPPIKKDALILSGKDINGDKRTFIKLFEKDRLGNIKWCPEEERRCGLDKYNKAGWITSKKTKAKYKSDFELLDELWIAYKFNNIINNLLK